MKRAVLFRSVPRFAALPCEISVARTRPKREPTVPASTSAYVKLRAGRRGSGLVDSTLKTLTSVAPFPHGHAVGT